MGTQIYLDPDDGFLYRQKENGEYVLVNTNISADPSRVYVDTDGVLHVKALFSDDDIPVSTSLIGPQGAQGEQGVKGDKGEKGEKGESGKPVYTWIKYADDQYGGGISDSPINTSGQFKKYIGFAYNQNSPIESGNPDEYKWSLLKGEQGDPGKDGADGQDGKDGADGKDGTNGIPGPKGEDGITYYTWIKYSDKIPSSNDELYESPIPSTEYIGIAANQREQKEKLDYTLYTWSKFKGDQGVKGEDGIGFKVEFPENPKLGDTFTWGGDSGLNDNCFLGYVMTGQQYVYSQLPGKLGFDKIATETCLIPMHILMYIPDLITVNANVIQRSAQVQPLTFINNELVEQVTTITHPSLGTIEKHMSWTVSYGLTDTQIKHLQPYIINIAKSIFDIQPIECENTNYAKPHSLPKYLQGAAMKCSYTDLITPGSIMYDLFEQLKDNASAIFNGLQRAIAEKLDVNEDYNPTVYLIPIQAISDENLCKSWTSELSDLTEGWAPCSSVLHNGFNTNQIGNILNMLDIGDGEIEIQNQ